MLAHAHPGQDHVQRRQLQHRLEEEVHVGFEHAVHEAEAQAAPGRIPRPEPQRALDQPGQQHEHRQDQRDVHRPQLEMRAQAQADDDDVGDQASLEDGDRVGQVFEAGAGEMGVAVEIALGAHLGPGRIDAQGQHRQQQVHEPDAEELAGGAGELETVALGRRWRLDGRKRRRQGRQGRRLGAGLGVHGVVLHEIPWFRSGSPPARVSNRSAAPK